MKGLEGLVDGEAHASSPRRVEAFLAQWELQVARLFDHPGTPGGLVNEYRNVV